MATIDVKDAAGATVPVQAPNANGQATMANSRPVVFASDQTPIPVGGFSAVVSGTFSRPADTTAYTIGDIVANSTTAGSVAPVALAVARANGGTGSILRARLSTTKTGLAGTEIFRVHLFTTSPTVSSGDNAAISVAGRAAGYIGAFDVTMSQVYNDGAKGIAGPLQGSQVVFVAGGATTNVWAVLEARTAYTPASGETFVIELETLRD